jgi:hypothetical protein
VDAQNKRCGAPTEAYRFALPELRLASLRRSSALQSDRQRRPMRYLEVRLKPDLGTLITTYGRAAVKKRAE